MDEKLSSLMQDLGLYHCTGPQVKDWFFGNLIYVLTFCMKWFLYKELFKKINLFIFWKLITVL